MHVLIMGAGIAGVTAAWQLLEDGHEVTVVERQAGGGRRDQLCQRRPRGARPRLRLGLAQSRKSPAQVIVPEGSAAALPVLGRARASGAGRCSSSPSARASGRAATRKIKHRLCRYSQAALQDVAGRTGIAYDGERRGILYLHRTQATLDRGAANMQILREAGPAARGGRPRAGGSDRSGARGHRRKKSPARSTARATRAAMPASSAARSPRSAPGAARASATARRSGGWTAAATGSSGS